MFFSDPEVLERVGRLELPWNRYGYDPYGISKKHLTAFFSLLAPLYRHYFRVKCAGIDHVPARGRAMLIGNHSGGIAVDAAMLLTGLLLEGDSPRLAQGMAEKFINRLPLASMWTSRAGQFTGLPEHAETLLHDDRLLMIFPEGARGTAKLYWERHSLVDFGTGFMRLALKTGSPIVPVGILGGGEAIPSVVNSKWLGKWVGAPYVPLTPYLLPIPLPVTMELRFGPPMQFEGTGTEEDEVVVGYVEQVKSAITGLMSEGLYHRGGGRG